MRPAARLIPKVGRGVGLGHLMRCLALGMKLLERGATDIAVLLPAGAAERDLVRRAGIRTETLEAERALRGDRAYVVDLELPLGEWPLRFASGPLAVAAIDDAGLALADVDLIVNPNVHADPSWYPGGSALAVGSKFALLRREFELARRRLRTTRLRGHRVVVSMGGGDAPGAIDRVLEGLADLDARVDVLLGPRSRRPIRRPNGTKTGIVIRRSPPVMAPHFLAADLAVTGGGSTLYEVAACGTPAISLSLNPSQETHARRWSELGATEYLGLVDRVSPEDLGSTVHTLLGDASRRRRMATKGRSIVDGRGTDRVATMLFRVIAHPRGIRR